MSDKKEACGLIGITNHPNAAKLTSVGLFALQHRGEESCGIAYCENGRIHNHTRKGLVLPSLGKNFPFASLPPATNKPSHAFTTAAIGHTRYSVTGNNQDVNMQPMCVDHLKGVFAVAHNGNLTNSKELKLKLEQVGAIFQSNMDSEIFIHLIAKSAGKTFKDCIIDALHQVQGSYSLLVLTSHALYAMRDPHGFRPLALGEISRDHDTTAMVVASETCALDFMNATYLGSLAPGELVTLHPNESKDSKRAITREEVFTHEFKKRQKIKQASCIFELIYFARPDSIVFDESVYAFRKRLGILLAEEAPVPHADMVIPIPDSGNYPALGYAEKTRLPIELAITRNHYASRSFIQPKSIERRNMANLKLNPIQSVIKGKKVVVVDDSIVRGTTTKEKILRIRRCGAKEIHLRIASPPIKYGCYYGIDFPDKNSLIANNKTIDDIRDFLEVDSLAYLSLDALLKANANKSNSFCSACFTGDYPAPVDTSVRKDSLAVRT